MTDDVLFLSRDQVTALLDPDTAFGALSTADSAELALIGSGTQALAHARAGARVRNLKSV